MHVNVCKLTMVPSSMRLANRKTALRRVEGGAYHWQINATRLAVGSVCCCGFVT